MKKSVSILLCLMLALGTISVLAFADSSRTETFINDVESSKSLSASVTDESVAVLLNNLPIKVTNVKGYLVGTDAALTAKVSFLKVKVVISDGQIIACIGSIFKANISEIMGIDSFDTSIFEDVWAKIDTFTQSKTKGHLKYDGIRTNVDGCDIETYVPDIKAIALDAFAAAIPPETNVDDMTQEEIIALLSNDAQAAQQIALWSRAKAEFYYKAGTSELVNIIITVPNKDGTEMATTDVAEMLYDEIGLEISGIGTNVSKSNVSVPKFAFNITGLVRSILGRFMK